MITSRRDFLALDLYYPIITNLTKIIASSGKNHVFILDAGCGEGYYTSRIKLELEKLGVTSDIYAIDVSKDAIALASKAYKNISFSVASINALPFESKSFDFVLSLFAPLCEKEFSRVLKNNGTLVTVSPSENHLFGLKKIIYDTPYQNPRSTFEPTLFTKKQEDVNEWQIEINSKQAITNLFKMTPYYYNTGSKGIEKACSISSLSTDIGFVFGQFKKT